MIRVNTVYQLKNKRYIITGADIKNGHIEAFDIQDKNEQFWQFSDNGSMHVFDAEKFEYVGTSTSSPGGNKCGDIGQEVITFESFPAKHAIPKPSSFLG